MPKKRKLRLTIEMVPPPCAQKNLRNLLGKEKWGKIRKDTLWKANYTCQVCGEEEKWLQIHEVWEYDDTNHIQTLKGFIALCPMCHLVKHIGFAYSVAFMQEGTLDFEELVEHFIRINHCREKTFFRHLEESVVLNEKRGAYDWKTVMKDFIPKPKTKHPPIYIGGKRYD